MAVIKETIRAGINFDEKLIVVDVNFDWVQQEVYINSVVYEGTDIKSMLSDAGEKELEERLTSYCIVKNL
jgi:hypothetical protein